MEEGHAVAAAQQIRSEQLGRAAMATTQRLDLMASRLDRALQWNANLEARVGLASLVNKWISLEEKCRKRLAKDANGICLPT